MPVTPLTGARYQTPGSHAVHGAFPGPSNSSDDPSPSRHVDIAVAVCFAVLVPTVDPTAWWLPLSPASLSVLLAILVPAVLAVACARTAPGMAMALVWASSIIQVFTLRDLFLVQLAAPIVAYAAARHGSRLMVALSGVSIVVGILVGAAYLVGIGSWALLDVDVIGAPGRDSFLLSRLIPFGLSLAVPLATPWVIGVIVRFVKQKDIAELRQREARHDADQARELARLRAENASLARDVHDIVGHSLAVIIAQADSIGFTPDGEVPRIREATANIATTARRSLMNIQDVLSRTTDATGDIPVHEAQVTELVDSIRDAGRLVERDDHGAARTVPPQVAKVAYRVMQEMLTNALRHAAPTSPIRIMRAWTYRTYAFTVENDFDPSARTAESGRGITGMRERVAAIGGTLHVEVNPGGDGRPRFTASAVLPLNPAEDSQ
ncbi:Signal transduction histidine kinase [Stackebrandtia soli]